MAFTPIIFGEKETEQRLDRLPATSGITSVDETATGYWDIHNAAFQVGFDEERYGSFSRELDNNGFSSTDQTATLKSLYTMTGDEKYKPNQTAATGGTGQLLGLREDGYNSRPELFKEFYQNDELLDQYEEYVKANPDLNLKPIKEVKALVQAQHEERRANLQSALSRNDSDFQKFAATLTGTAGGVLLDPVLIPGFIASAGLGAGATALRIAAIFGGITFIEETFIQQDVSDFKEILGEDYNAWENVFLASGFAAAIPILGKGLGKALKGGRSSLNAKFRPNYEKLKELSDEINSGIKHTENWKMGDAYEINRGQRLFEATGTVRGGKLHIHNPKEIVLDGINKGFSKSLVTTESKQIASTIRAKMGVDAANKVLEQAKKSDIPVESITPKHIEAMMSQGKKSTDLDLADDFVKADGKSVVKQSNPVGDGVKKVDETEDFIFSDADIKQLNDINARVSREGAKDLPILESIAKKNNELDELDEFVRCKGG